MIRPAVLADGAPYGPTRSRGSDIWDAFMAAARGETEALAGLLDRDPELVRAEYWYTGPLWFAVREGRADTVRLLLERGADPGWQPLDGEDLAVTARERGHEAVATLIEQARADRPPSPAPAGESGYAARHFEALDHALWAGPYWAPRTDLDEARRLAGDAASVDLVIASALGDSARVDALLTADPEGVDRPRPHGKRALSTAVQFGHRAIARSLLEHGADPNASEGAIAPRGTALWWAARLGDRELVELLLDHGADPDAEVDSSGTPTYAAATPKLRTLLLERGGHLDPYDLVWLDEDDAALARVRQDPASAHRGCGGVLAAACKNGKRELVRQLLDAGVRVPDSLTPCRSYLWSEPETLQALLASGMDPDLPDWRHATPLHDLCSRDARGRPRPHRERCAQLLLEAGASPTAREEDYRSTPLAWAARNDLPEMVELLLACGAPPALADDEPWATPLAWAERRGHAEIALRLRAAGAGR